MLDSILTLLLLCTTIASLVTIPIGFFYSAIFGIVLFYANDKLSTEKRHLPIISFIFLPPAILIALYLGIGLIFHRGESDTLWRISLFMPLMVNTILLIGWLFLREILSPAYYTVWTVMLLISAYLGIAILFIIRFF